MVRRLHQSFPHNQLAAEAICDDLEASDVRRWVDFQDGVPGEPWEEGVIKAFWSSRIKVLVFTKHANASDLVKREVAMGVRGGSIVGALRVEDVLPAEKHVETLRKKLNTLPPESEESPATTLSHGRGKSRASDQPLLSSDKSAERSPKNPATESRHVVITLHGIRTHAGWQKELNESLSEAGFTPKSLDYGWFGVFPFLSKKRRDRKVKWFLAEYQKITHKYPETVPSVIAHSFGTYILARAISLYGGPMIKFDRIIFCGSIVSEDFDWSKAIEGGVVNWVLNDYGRSDRWAGIVHFFLSDAGPSGKHGFKDTAKGKVDQRRHPEWGHDHFFFELNYTKRWIPFLKGRSFTDVTLKPHFHVPIVWAAVGIVSLIVCTLIIWIFQMMPSPLSNAFAYYNRGGSYFEKRITTGRSAIIRKQSG